MTTVEQTRIDGLLDGLRAAEAEAEQTLAHAAPRFDPSGYRRVFDPRTRQLIAQEPEPAEAEIVAELYRRLIKGHSLRAIDRDFQARGIRTRTGRVFSAEHLRSVAILPVYAALRAHRAGGTPCCRSSSSTRASGPPWCPRADWQAVQRLLRSPNAKPPAPG